jgi:uncharacterized protein YcbK (DUF882 family)
VSRVPTGVSTASRAPAPTLPGGAIAKGGAVTLRAPGARAQDVGADPIPACGRAHPLLPKCYLVLSTAGSLKITESLNYNRILVSAEKVLRVNAAGGPQIKIVRAWGPNDTLAHSFTTSPGENTITLRAEVTPASAAGSVKWTVTANRAGTFTPRLPTILPADGASSSFIIPASVRADTSRWPRQHAASMGDTGITIKRMSYTIVASVALNGQTLTSAPMIVKQDADDVLRQEYVDWRQASIPARSELVSIGDAGRNNGDYDHWPSLPLLVERMPVLQSLAAQKFGQNLTVTGGYRNPVHHVYHIARGLDRNGHPVLPAHESQHLYGGATDFRISDFPRGYTAKTYFDAIGRLAHRDNVGGCFEPDAFIRAGANGVLDHAHVHWGVACRDGW